MLILRLVHRLLESHDHLQLFGPVNNLKVHLDPLVIRHWLQVMLEKVEDQALKKLFVASHASQVRAEVDLGGCKDQNARIFLREHQTREHLFG